jgi:hypothetical protein
MDSIKKQYTTIWHKKGARLTEITSDSKINLVIKGFVVKEDLS